MRVDSEKLPEVLRQGLKLLYVIHGEEALLALEAADRLRVAARKDGFEEREVLTVEPGFDWSRLAMAAATRSLFASRRLLELRIPSGRPGVEGGSALAGFAKRLPADTVSLVMLPKLDRTQLASAWFTALDAAGVCVVANAVPPARLTQWLSARLAAQRQDADPATLELLAQRVEGNLLAAHQEVRKLGLLLAEGRLEFEAVRQSVLDVARYDVFKLRDALLEGQMGRVLRILDGLRGEGVATPLVLWAVTEDTRALLRLNRGLAAGRPGKTLASELKLFGDRAERLLAVARGASAPALEQALLAAAAADRVNKGLGRGDPWDALLGLCEQVMRACRAGRREAPNRVRMPTGS